MVKRSLSKAIVTTACAMGSLFIGTAFHVACAQGSATASPTTQVCVKQADAPEWFPCGPDRVLSEIDLNTYLFKPALATKMLMTPIAGKYAGKNLRLVFHPDGKFEAGIVNANGSFGNIGKQWKLEGDNLCRTYTTGDNQCNKFEISAGKVYWVTSAKHPVDSIEFFKP